MPYKNDIELRVEKYPAVVYIDSISNKHISAAKDISWLLEQNRKLEAFERAWKQHLQPHQLEAEFVKVFGDRGEPVEQYIQVWVDETETWHFVKGSLDPSLYPTGYADYYLLVSNGIIRTDELRPEHEGKLFAEVYKDTQWTETVSS